MADSQPGSARKPVAPPHVEESGRISTLSVGLATLAEALPEVPLIFAPRNTENETGTLV